MVFALAVGPSSDATAAIAAELAAPDPRVVVVENPTGLTPQGLNIAARAGIEAQPSSVYLVRTDGHADAARRLRAHRRRHPRAHGRRQRRRHDGAGRRRARCRRRSRSRCPTRSGSAAAGSTPAAPRARPTPSTSASFRRADVRAARRVRRALVARAGLGAEPAPARERRARVVHAADAGRVPARAASFRALASQFYKTGQWRREVVRRYPQTASPRYLAPPVAVVAIALGLGDGLSSGWSPVCRGWLAALIVPAVYLARRHRASRSSPGGGCAPPRWCDSLSS